MDDSRLRFVSIPHIQCGADLIMRFTVAFETPYAHALTVSENREDTFFYVLYTKTV